eukprot:gene9747-9905_t
MGTWQAHSQWVSQLQGLAVGSPGDTQLLSCSHDKTLKLWDLRMLRPEANGSRFCAMSQGAGRQTVEPVIRFKGVKEGIEGFVVYQDAALVHGGSHLGLAPLNVQHVTNNVIYPVKMTGIRGAGRATSGGGGSSGSAIVGLGLLPHSRLLVVGSEDGQDYGKFVQFFRQASPYIEGHRGRTFVVVIPGDVVMNQELLQAAIADIAILNGLGIRLVLVLGAQQQINDALELQGSAALFVGGYRATTPACSALMRLCLRGWARHVQQARIVALVHILDMQRSKGGHGRGKIPPIQGGMADER